MRSHQRLRRYESLTKLRQRQEDMKAQLYAIAERDVQVATQERDRLEAQQQQLLYRTSVPKGDTIDKQQQLSLSQFERHTARRIVEQDATIQACRVVSDEKHAALKEAMVERKMMETLSEHAREEIETEWHRQERYATDEIASQRTVHQLKSQP